MTDDLMAFLKACLDEDEQAALEAMHRPRSRPPTVGHWGYVHEDLVDGDGLVLAPKVWILAASHIARHDPARVLAEVQAKRRIIDEHLSWRGKQNDDGVYCATCVGYPINTHSVIGVAWPCPTLRLLALPYQGRDGWRAEWAPDEEENRG